MSTIRIAVAVIGCSLLAASLIAITWNPTTQKYEVSGEEVAYYDSAECKGQPAGAMVSNQSQSNLALLSVPSEYGGGTWNDRISCIQTGPNASARFCTDKNFGGKCMDVSGGRLVSLSGNSTFNNKISSMRKPAK